MRRWRRYLLPWAVMFAGLVGLRAAFGEPLVEALAYAAVTASLWTWLFTHHMSVPAPAGDDERGARWRTCPGGRPGRWRTGWLHRSGSGLVAIPMTGDAGPRIQPADVRGVRERAARLGESRTARGEMRVLEVELADGGADLVVAAADVPAVRRWLGES